MHRLASVRNICATVWSRGYYPRYLSWWVILAYLKGGELMTSLEKYIDVGEFQIGEFYLVPSDPRSICQLSVTKKNADFATCELPDKYLSVLSHRITR